ncbi:hypothetical protein ES703_56453 [subsurface metagenome]
MPRAGQVLFHKNFIYDNGSTGEKLLIALNTCDNEETCLVLKTTSQPKRYAYAVPGCNSGKGIFCIFEECEQGFPDDTYVQLDSIYPINVELLLNSGQVSFIDHLSEVCFTNLKRCLRNFREDIPQQYWTIIYSP